MKKKELEIVLSGLKTFNKQKLNLEQYQTEAHIAADFLWYVFMQGDIEGKIVGDFGCGNGILGIGALLLGAKKVYFLDIDNDAIRIAKENVKLLEERFIFNKIFVNKNIGEFKNKVDLVLQNPPFGVKKTHADKPFLLQAMKCGKKIYSFHKIETKDFIEKFVKNEGKKIKFLKKYDFPLRKGKGAVPKGYAFWKKNLHTVNVGVWVIEA